MSVLRCHCRGKMAELNAIDQFWAIAKSKLKLYPKELRKPTTEKIKLTSRLHFTSSGTICPLSRTKACDQTNTNKREGTPDWTLNLSLSPPFFFHFPTFSLPFCIACYHVSSSYISQLNCFICRRSFSVAQKLRNHIFSNHGIDLEPRKHGLRRFNTEQFMFIKKTSDASHALVEVHYECPSCLDHYATMDELKAHLTAHIRKKQDNKKRNASASTSGELGQPSSSADGSAVSIKVSLINLVLSLK
ncbi:hypothetical protein DM01DRAFT_89020 [Hesseltinella vesiculosa]|uniref:C2H2-type domain-containing protein n=1 Tax=Hesseltinella vesiculosa TaxID=101127 RepID=A0A1X2GS24_9FUNG|nr:hypothetical protein DM01DRAFT_89020 [Hesseltinella vesiculosa]